MAQERDCQVRNDHTEMLTYVSPHSKKNVPLTLKVTAVYLSHESGHTLSLSASSLLKFLKMICFHSKQD